MALGCVNDLRSETRWTLSWISKPQRRLRRRFSDRGVLGQKKYGENNKNSGSPLFSFGPSVLGKRGLEDSQEDNVRENPGLVCIFKEKSSENVKVAWETKTDVQTGIRD